MLKICKNCFWFDKADESIGDTKEGFCRNDKSLKTDVLEREFCKFFDKTWELKNESKLKIEKDDYEFQYRYNASSSINIKNECYISINKKNELEFPTGDKVHLDGCIIDGNKITGEIVYYEDNGGYEGGLHKKYLCRIEIDLTEKKITIKD